RVAELGIHSPVSGRCGGVGHGGLICTLVWNNADLRSQERCAFTQGCGRVDSVAVRISAISLDFQAGTAGWHGETRRPGRVFSRGEAGRICGQGEIRNRTVAAIATSPILVSTIARFRGIETTGGASPTRQLR